MRINEFVRNNLMNQAQVISKIKIAPAVYRLTIHGDIIKNLIYKTGQHIHVLVQPYVEGSVFKMAVNRNYSIWNHDLKSGILELAICQFSDGPGARWIEELTTGDHIFFTSPTGRLTLSDQFKHHIFIGDISALGHFYFMRRKLPHSDSYQGFIYGNESANMFADVDSTFPFEFIPQSDNLISTLQSLIQSNESIELHNSMIYIGGNGKICQGLSKSLKHNCQLNNQNFTIKPFWLAGKKGM